MIRIGLVNLMARHTASIRHSVTSVKLGAIERSAESFKDTMFGIGLHQEPLRQPSWLYHHWHPVVVWEHHEVGGGRERIPPFCFIDRPRKLR